MACANTYVNKQLCPIYEVMLVRLSEKIGHTGKQNHMVTHHKLRQLIS